MQRFMLKSKIHRATVTATELHYEGSIAIDKLLLNEADILPGEQVHVLNVNTSERIITYAIEVPAGSGIISLRGAAARTGQVGDLVIIITYAAVSEAERATFTSQTVYVNAKNQQVVAPTKCAIQKNT